MKVNVVNTKQQPSNVVEAGQFRTNKEGEIALIVEHGGYLNIVVFNGEHAQDGPFLEYDGIHDGSRLNQYVKDEYPYVVQAKVVVE